MKLKKHRHECDYKRWFLLIPLQEIFKILGCVMNRQGKTLDALEDRMAISQQGLLERSLTVETMTKIKRLRPKL